MEGAQESLKKANALLKNRAFEEALEHYNEASRLFPKVKKNCAFLVQRGSALMGCDKLLEALVCFEEAVAIDPKNATAWFKQGTVLKSQRKFAEAAGSFEKACQLSPEMDAARLSFIRTLLLLQHFDKAYEAGMEAIKVVQPSRRVALDRLFIYACAQSGHETDAEESAVNLVKAYQEGSPDAEFDEQTILVLANVLTKVAVATQEMRYWQMACVVDPSFNNILCLGIAYLQKGSFHEAEKAFAIAQRLSPNEWHLYQYLGLLYFKKKEYRKSTLYFQQAFELSSRTPPGSPRDDSTQQATELIDSSVYREGQGRMISRVQLCLGTALLNGGDLATARHHISCAAHSRGSVRNLARILLTALELRLGSIESAMNTLNLVRNEIDVAVFDVARPRSVSSFGGFVIDDDSEENPSVSTTQHIVSLHYNTGLLAGRVLGLIESGELERTEAQRRKLIELQKTCFNDCLRRDPNHELAKKALQEINASPRKSGSVPILRKAASYHEGRTSRLPHFDSMNSNPEQLSGSERLKLYAEQEERRKAFLQSLQARRAQLEHDIDKHDDGDSDFEFI